MLKNFVEELRWRGMLHDITPETEEFLLSNKTTGYIGFDPTANSLHIGSLVQIIILIHFQNFGHKPIVLLGGATGMIGDPAGKTNERKLLDAETLEINISSILSQFKKFLNFENDKKNFAILINNYSWMKNFSLIDFSRQIGKNITVNYMMAKDSVKKRLKGETKDGMSFTEFTYQLIQGYDFLYLYDNYNCKIQLGGSDQWGNITTGTELIRRKSKGKAYAITCPLITKADGTKFGKTEDGNIWLDKNKTSVYKFYQYWLNTSDEDASSYIKIFTFLDFNSIKKIINSHKKNPHLRVLQTKLADAVTELVHGKEELDNVRKASNILFGKNTSNDLMKINPKTFLEIFDGVPQAQFSRNILENGFDILSALSQDSGFLKSISEARRSLKENAISVNKLKVSEKYILTSNDLIGNKFILLQRGKKNYFILKFN
ncbi:MAG: tyrosine--tRNA ligase [Flavobacteriaceae bacterium]|jgi:tyrosyl-tRNA synthetase|nr:tyrosine--tRNA ligase [Flavobacteriaceae bacterium]MBQ22762.1 tyrosine--tRNA ligase [Flavobacteriales bacterium]|tara:strand:+ start:1007 stop:2302 length:1296 start_codon:yes stop_codon:yes gene_type:complete